MTNTLYCGSLFKHTQLVPFIMEPEVMRSQSGLKMRFCPSHPSILELLTTVPDLDTFVSGVSVP